MNTPGALAEAQRRAAALELIAFDVDGTLTDGRIHIGPSGEAMKSFSVRDGFGLALLRRAGIRLAIVTGRDSPIVAVRAAELGFDAVVQGVGDKAAVMRELCARFDVATAHSAFVGDDWPDLGAMAQAGFCATVAGAPPEVRARAHWVSTAAPGEGAVREFAEFVLRARGQWEALFAEYVPPAAAAATDGATHP